MCGSCEYALIHGLEKLNTIVRSLQTRQETQSSHISPVRSENSKGNHRHHYAKELQLHPAMHAAHGHVRNSSAGTAGTMPEVISRQQSFHTGQNDNEKNHAAEAALASKPRKAIPHPIVTIRSEYPTLYRSRQPQSVTCLITVEVIEGSWQPDVEDPGSMRLAPFRSSAGLDRFLPSSPVMGQKERKEASEELARVAKALHARVDNWHGLDFSR